MRAQDNREDHHEHIKRKAPGRLRLCAWTLARAHARSGDSIEIAGYLGSSEDFDRAIAAFADSYADQNERDHAALVDAIATGRVQANAEA